MEKKLWRRLPKYVLTLGIILSGFFATQVNAACTNGTNSQAYYNNGTWTSINANTSWQNIPSQSSRLLIAQTNSNIKNSNLNYTIRINMSATGNWQTNPTIEVRYGTSSSYINIANQCSIRWTRNYIYNDNLVVGTNWQNEIICNYQGANTSANYIGVVYEMSSIPISSIQMTSRCLTLSPSDLEQIINNDNNNTNEIRNDMYEYYDSLYEKSNAQEQVIINEIDDQANEIKEALEVDDTNKIDVGTTGEDWEDIDGKEEGLINSQGIGNMKEVLEIDNTTEITGGKYLWHLTNYIVNTPLINTTHGDYNLLRITYITCLTFGLLKLILRR